MNTLTRLDSR